MCLLRYVLNTFSNTNSRLRTLRVLFTTMVAYFERERKKNNEQQMKVQVIWWIDSICYGWKAKSSYRKTSKHTLSYAIPACVRVCLCLYVRVTCAAVITICY